MDDLQCNAITEQLDCLRAAVMELVEKHHCQHCCPHVHAVLTPQQKEMRRQYRNQKKAEVEFNKQQNR